MMVFIIKKRTGEIDIELDNGLYHINGYITINDDGIYSIDRSTFTKISSDINYADKYLRDFEKGEK